MTEKILETISDIEKLILMKCLQIVKEVYQKELKEGYVRTSDLTATVNSLFINISREYKLTVWHNKKKCERCKN